ncbi:MAG: DUF2490 domain-containing protein [Candidatus Thiodiazotropha sp. (ex Monitilora ramsayi)]|nr:DUF2490 domain-containing protein [Candidatus Thiodiazotropha sp. (ex Monitilora ramsayi)]
MTIRLTMRPRLLFFILILLTGSPLFAESDSGGSYNLLIKIGLDDDWFIISRSNLASRDDFTDTFFRYTGGGLGYQLTDSWSLRGGYRRAWIQLQGDWLPENRFYLEGFYATRWDAYRLTNRARIERRTFDYREDDVRLRNEIVIEGPAGLLGESLKPYFEEEFFYSTKADRFEANWLGGGLAWRPAKGVKLKLGYRWNRFRVGGDWRNRHVLVTGLNLFF